MPKLIRKSNATPLVIKRGGKYWGYLPYWNGGTFLTISAQGKTIVEAEIAVRNYYAELIKGEEANEHA